MEDNEDLLTEDGRLLPEDLRELTELELVVRPRGRIVVISEF